MMYRHTITIYDSHGNRKAKIQDEVNLRDFGYNEYAATNIKGGPVEAVFTKDGRYLWVSNYSMVGEGFENPGCDACNGSEFDPGFLYKINMGNYEIENVVKVGSVPKFLAISDDQKKLVVSNWSSGDVSVVDLDKEVEVKRIKVGTHPRGIDITADSKIAYVTVMGSTKIAEIDLETYDKEYISNVGKSPRSLILADHDSTLYISMNSGSSVLKYNRFTEDRKFCKTASGPRSMCITPEEDFIYVVNYFDHSFSKISTDKMEVVEQVTTSAKPIGICGNWDASEIWVACYSGRIEIFKDFHLDSLRNGTSMLGLDLSSFWAFTHQSVTTENSPETVKNAEPEKEEPEEMMGLENKEVETSEIEDEVEEIENTVVSPKRPLNTIQKNRFPDKIVQPTGECTYHVIAGSFSDPNNAEKRKDELISKGYSAVVIEGNLNYVSAVCYANRGDAEGGVNQVKSNTGYSAWILKR